MAIKIDFKGHYNTTFFSVKPKDIVLKGQVLTIQGTKIPVHPTYLYTAFGLFAHEAAKEGKLSVILESRGFQYCSETANGKVNSFISRMIEAGQVKCWNYPNHYSDRIPPDDEYLVGDDY